MRSVWLILLVIAGGVAAFLWTRFESDAPAIKTRTARGWVGDGYRHQFRISDDGMGVESVRIWLESGGEFYELASETYPGNLFMGADLNIQRRVEAVIKPQELGIADGAATLHAEARDYSWRGNVSAASVPLRIDTRAPRISLHTGLTYVRRGGAAAVVYTVDEATEKDGVALGDLFFAGFTHPEDPERRVAFYAVPPDVPVGTLPSLVAVDRAGNRITVPMRVEVIERSFLEDTIALDLDFMALKVAEIGKRGDGGTLDSYLAINRDLRAANAATILEIAATSSDDRLWTERFMQLPNSSAQATFGTRRTYTFNGKKVDRQVHLGVDVASTSQAAVPAANDGVVAFAGDLGIYGNTIILDHGLGLFSLYGHLSEIAVEKGEVVPKGGALGHTGSTGLAGGDHLHFSMLVHGVFVDPMEWFDPRWIREHVEPKLELSEG